MELTTEAGARVLVTMSENGRLLIFDRRVATLELTDEEALRLARALGREKQVRLSQVIHELIGNGYFAQARSFVDIRDRLRSDGLRVKSASLHVLVTNLTERGQLTREGSRRAFTYRCVPNQSVT